MQRIKNLRDMLCDELCDYGEKESLTAQDLEIVESWHMQQRTLIKY